MEDTIVHGFTQIGIIMESVTNVILENNFISGIQPNTEDTESESNDLWVQGGVIVCASDYEN